MPCSLHLDHRDYRWFDRQLPASNSWSRWEQEQASALAVLLLQLGLLVALLRYRLYDAEVVIGRSVNFAVVTLGVAAIFAAAGDAVNRSSILIRETRTTKGRSFSPRHWRRSWSTDPGTRAALVGERFQRTSSCSATTFRNRCATCAKQRRHETLDEILAQVDAGVRAVEPGHDRQWLRAQLRGLGSDQVEEWRSSVFAQDYRERHLRAFPTDCFRSMSLWSPARMKSQSALSSSAAARWIDPGRESRRRSPKSPRHRRAIRTVISERPAKLRFLD